MNECSAPVKNVHDLQAGDIVHWPAGARSTVLDNDRLGYGQWRITLSPVDTNEIEQHDVPGGWLVYVDA
jgi:hypothetical protein